MSGFNDAKPNPDGSFTIPISDDVAARIDKLRRPGESDNDVLTRVIREGTSESFVPGRDGRHRARAITRTTKR